MCHRRRTTILKTQARDTTILTVVVIWNNPPKERHGLSPHELFTRVKQPSFDLIRGCRVWGCPVYVLKAKLQDGHRLPKWNKRSRLGMYLGCSASHSYTVGLVMNFETGFISPQYHVIWDERFTSVQGNLDDELFNADEWNQLITWKANQDLFGPPDNTSANVNEGTQPEAPTSDEMWTFRAILDHQGPLRKQDRRCEGIVGPRPGFKVHSMF